MLAGLSSTAPAMQTKAFLGIGEWKFLRPLFIGDTVRVRTAVTDLNSKNRRQGRVTWRRELLNQADEVVQQGNFETMVACSSFRVRRDDDQGAGSAADRQASPNLGSSTPARPDPKAEPQRKSA